MTTPSTANIEVTERLDCSGLLCPLPVYKAGVVLNRLAPGEVLELITTDPGALQDVPALARQRGDRLVGSQQSSDSHVFWLEKGGAR